MSPDTFQHPLRTSSHDAVHRASILCKSKSSERICQRASGIQMSSRFHRPPCALEDDYVLTGRTLGDGMNGAVREAVRKAGGEKFAVKPFKLLNATESQKDKFELEVQIFLLLDHPHIARLVDVYESTDYLHLVMECMEGGELFDRLMALKRFSEQDAAHAIRQMLLSVNYIHEHGIVHRDLKLENFLYVDNSSRHLKLIDFGFSNLWDPNTMMRYGCGTLSYVAPEVLNKAYTSQCDLWSLGVIAFILLSGSMPFSGNEEVQRRNIAAGQFKMKPQRWDLNTEDAKDFVTSLLKVDPHQRLTAEAAIAHTFIAGDRPSEGSAGPHSSVDESVVEALRAFGKASKFRRCCMSMMAWSLTNSERAKVRQHFLDMDKTRGGTITLSELRNVLVDKFDLPDEETRAIFEALDSNHDEEIYYTDFLAAMVSTRIEVHDGLLKQAFARFDIDRSGYITADNLKDILGDACEGLDVSQLLKEADLLNDGRISYPEFVAYINCTPLESHQDAAARIIDREALGRVWHWRGNLRRKSASLPSPPTVERHDRLRSLCCVVL